MGKGIPWKMFNCMSSKAQTSPTYENDSDDSLYNDDFIADQNARQLILIRDHPARLRRRSSAVPTTQSIVEDQVLESICNDKNEEPELAADRLSKADRKRLVRRLSRTASISVSDVLNTSCKNTEDSILCDDLINLRKIANQANTIDGRNSNLSYANYNKSNDSNETVNDNNTPQSSDMIRAKCMEKFRRISCTSTTGCSITDGIQNFNIAQKAVAKFNSEMGVGTSSVRTSVFEGLEKRNDLDDCDKIKSTTTTSTGLNDCQQTANSMYYRQQKGRRKSIASHNKNGNIKTTMSGKSQYPLPGSHIKTTVGGTFDTSKTTNNFLNEDEILNEVQSANRRKDSIFGKLSK